MADPACASAHQGPEPAPSSKRPYLVVLALVAAVSFALSLVITYVMPAVAFFSLPTRAWQLAAGGLVALTADQWRRLPPRAAAITGWAGLAVILLACTQLSPTTLYPGIAALLPTLGAALVIGAGCAAPAQGCGRVLGLSPMRAIGRISYSWYLWHWPVLVLAPALLGHPLGLAARLAAALLSGGLAVLTLRFIENPLRFAAPIRRSAWASLALGGVATAVAVCVGVALLVWVPVPVGRGPAADATDHHRGASPRGLRHGRLRRGGAAASRRCRPRSRQSADLKAVPSNLDPPLTRAAAEHNAMLFNGCLRNFSEGGQPECATGDTASTTTVALVGDSHAAMWNPAFQQIAAQRHWRLEMLAKAACPLLDLPITNPVHRPVSTPTVRAVARSDHRPVTRRAPAADRAEPIAAIRRHDTVGVRFHVLRPGVDRQPDPPGAAAARHRRARCWCSGRSRIRTQSVPICLSGHLDDATACSPPRSTAVNQPGIAAESAATKAGGGQYADLTELFCTADRCPVIVGNTLVYIDESHLTLEYSRLLAPVIGALADRALATVDTRLHRRLLIC